jgi:LPXTG-site transpeptidase (sortase) family protein
LIISPASANPGDDVTFALRLTNTGASPIGCNNTVATDAVCHLRFNSVQSDPNNTAINTVVATLEPQILNQVLQPGAQFTTTAADPPYTVAVTDQSTTVTVIIDGGYYSQALATADLLSYYVLLPPGATAEAELIVARPEITIALTVTPNPTVYSQSVTYGVTVTNTGTINVTNLVVTYQINPLAAAPGSTGVRLISGGLLRPALQATSGTIALNRDALAPGEAAQGFLAKIEDQTTSYVFIVTAVGLGGEPSVQVSDQTDVTLTPITTGLLTPTPTVDLSTLDPNAVDPIVEKKPNVEQTEPGSNVIWTITVRNGGTQVMSNVTLQDSVPETLTLNAASADRGATITDGQLVTLTTGQMNPGDTVTLTLDTTIGTGVTSPASITNTACAAREGGAQVCSTGTVNLGPNAGRLPETGLGSPLGASRGPVGGLLGISLAGALMILMAAQVSRQRMKIAVIFVVVAIVIVVVAVVLVATKGSGKPAPEQAAQVTPAATPGAGETAITAVSATPGAVAMQFPPTPTPYVLPTPAGPRYLLIPKLADQFKAPIPIVETPLINRKWDVSGLGYYVGWLQGTTWMDPGWGNTVLAAHVQLGFQNPGPFWGLGDLVPGDEIIVIEGDIQRKFVVKSIRKVDPNDVTVTAPTNSPTLTLITCTEWDNHYGLFSQRMVVQAVPAGQS